MKPIISCIAATLLLTTSCTLVSAEEKIKDPDNVSTITLTSPTLSSIAASRLVRLNFTPVASGTPTVRVTAPAEIMQYFSVEVEDGELQVVMKGKYAGTMGNISGNINFMKHVTIDVTAPQVTSVSASSGSVVTVKANWTAGASGTVSASSGGSLSTAPGVAIVSGKQMQVNVSSGASLAVGTMQSAEVEVSVSSGGSASIGGVKAKELESEVSSGASCAIAGINATQVEGKASSGASITLKGAAESVQLKASSGGSVSASSLKAQTGSAKASSGGSVSCNVKNLSMGKGKQSGVTNSAQ